MLYSAVTIFLRHQFHNDLIKNVFHDPLLKANAYKKKR